MSNIAHFPLQPLQPLRRLRAGTPPPPESDAFAQQVSNHVNNAVRAAYISGHADGEHSGYLCGARAGRLAAFVCGLLIGALGIVAALQLGLHWGAP